MSHLGKVLLVVFVACLLGSCKVAVVVVEGGEVQSLASGTCAEGTICIFEVKDTNFSESFTAVPKEGWHFVRWNSGWGMFCGDSTNLTCELTTVGLEGHESIEKIIASDQTFYLMPIFRRGPEFVTVDGKEWAQVDLFTNLSWNDINAVCPGGVCAGTLNGYDMTGWTWASVQDSVVLFNYYLFPGELEYNDFNYSYVFNGPADSAWTTAFYDDGWRATGYLDDPTQRATAGWVSDYAYSHSAWTAGIYDGNAGSDYVLSPFSQTSKTQRSEYQGAWFYRAL